MQSEVTFRCDDGFRMPSLLITPHGQPEAPRPGVLLIYEVYGITLAYSE
jgi:carboxymethylenebutenolidase